MPRPNILLLFPDGWRSDWLGPAGASWVQTPILDSLAAKGIRFSQCITPSPLCAPTRAALAFGCAYEECDVWDNEYNLPLDRPNFYQRLRKAGYSVGGVGKFDLAKALQNHGGDGRRLLPEWGFTHGLDSEGKWDGVNQMRRSPLTGPYGRYLESLGLRDLYLADMDKRAKSDVLGRSRPTPLPLEAYSDNWVTRSAVGCIREFPKDKPWFLQVNFPSPHDPFDPPAEIEAAQNGMPAAIRHTGYGASDMAEIRRAYAAMIANVDRMCGIVLSAVSERGDADKTLVVFSSDHGEMLGDYDRWGKSTWHEGSIRVPLIVAGPNVEQGQVCEALVQLQDLAPTFVEMGDSEPLPVGGRAITSLLRDPLLTHHAHLHSSLNGWSATMDARWKLVVENDEATLFFDRTRSDPDTPVSPEELPRDVAMALQGTRKRARRPT